MMILRTSIASAKHVATRKFTQSASRKGPYDESIHNLLINQDTKVICQGFTGKAGTFHAREAIDYGTQMMGGVSPKKAGQVHLDLPVFGSVKEAMRETKANASVIYVPPVIAANAIVLEAIENEVGLIVCVAEGIPEADQIKIIHALRSQSKSRFLGPNCPGIINPLGCKIGIQPSHIYKPGNIGIVSRSGTLSYESAAQITGIVFIGEIGGYMEEEAADYIYNYNKSLPNPKPIVGFIAGSTAPSERRMGHAGALITGGKGAASHKIAALSRAGVIMVESPSRIGSEMSKVE
ncbi:succinate-CoA ligase [Lentinula guzmanii]|uniref:Succinate-CoA ligase n=1 Tax=Lentinula guzmanii TaxID=2804957 RepID=A0AA38JMJ7_9AGAR|nr:succinate-CoA ligase [Lentinula guzmanii]